MTTPISIDLSHHTMRRIDAGIIAGLHKVSWGLIFAETVIAVAVPFLLKPFRVGIGDAVLGAIAWVGGTTGTKHSGVLEADNPRRII